MCDIELRIHWHKRGLRFRLGRKPHKIGFKLPYAQGAAIHDSTSLAKAHRII